MSGWTERLAKDVNRPCARPRGDRGNRHLRVSSGSVRQYVLTASLVALFPVLVRSCSENMLHPWKTSIWSQRLAKHQLTLCAPIVVLRALGPSARWERCCPRPGMPCGVVVVQRRQRWRDAGCSDLWIGRPERERGIEPERARDGGDLLLLVAIRASGSGCRWRASARRRLGAQAGCVFLVVFVRRGVRAGRLGGRTGGAP